MKIIIWGLRNKRHSHRYIHKGFYETFKRLGYETLWVDDSPKNISVVANNSVVLSVDIASKHLPFLKSVRYVLHNNVREEFKNSNNVLNLQVYTHMASGKSLGHPLILFNESNRTLYQPWGISDPVESWRTSTANPGNTEFWVGAVWNNALNQGNSIQIHEYKQALKAHNINFRRVGGTRWITKNGISSARNLELVNKSPIGAAIVGEWQKDAGYVPCRLFKNVAAGHIPISNGNYTTIFPTFGIFNNNIEELVSEGCIISKNQRQISIIDSQEILKIFTYSNAINRIQALL